MITLRVGAAVLELDVLYDLKLRWDDVVLEGALFSNPNQTMTTGALLLFFRQVMLDSNPRKVLGWVAPATCLSGVCRYLNFNNGLCLATCILVFE